MESNNDFVENMKELTSALEDMSGKMQESKRLLLNGFDEALGDLETIHHDLRVWYNLIKQYFDLLKVKPIFLFLMFVLVFSS